MTELSKAEARGKTSVATVPMSGQTPPFLLGSEQPLASFIDVRRVFLF